MTGLVTLGAVGQNNYQSFLRFLHSNKDLSSSSLSLVQIQPDPYRLIDLFLTAS